MKRRWPENFFQSLIFSREHCFTGFEIQIFVCCSIMGGRGQGGGDNIPLETLSFLLETPGLSFSKNVGNPVIKLVFSKTISSFCKLSLMKKYCVLNALGYKIHFSYYTLMIFLIMLSAILLSMLIILLSTLSVIRHLICGSN